MLHIESRVSSVNQWGTRKGQNPTLTLILNYPNPHIPQSQAIEWG